MVNIGKILSGAYKLVTKSYVPKGTQINIIPFGALKAASLPIAARAGAAGIKAARAVITGAKAMTIPQRLATAARYTAAGGLAYYGLTGKPPAASVRGAAASAGLALSGPGAVVGGLIAGGEALGSVAQRIGTAGQQAYGGVKDYYAAAGPYSSVDPYQNAINKMLYPTGKLRDMLYPMPETTINIPASIPSGYGGFGGSLGAFAPSLNISGPGGGGIGDYSTLLLLLLGGGLLGYGIGRKRKKKRKKKKKKSINR